MEKEKLRKAVEKSRELRRSNEYPEDQDDWSDLEGEQQNESSEE